MEYLSKSKEKHYISFTYSLSHLDMIDCAQDISRQSVHYKPELSKPWLGIVTTVYKEKSSAYNGKDKKACQTPKTINDYNSHPNSKLYAEALKKST